MQWRWCEPCEPVTFDCSVLFLAWENFRTIAGMATVLVGWESSMKSTTYEVLSVVKIAIVRKKKNREH
jgi:hypothetical protein